MDAHARPSTRGGGVAGGAAAGSEGGASAGAAAAGASSSSSVLVGGRLGSSSGGRPTTARPTSARPTTGRPKTARPESASRPVTRGGGGGGTASGAGGIRGHTPNVDAAGGVGALQEEYIDEWGEEEEEEEDYESDDDGDVFAFVPPDLGPSPANLTFNPLDEFGRPVAQSNAAGDGGNVSSLTGAPSPAAAADPLAAGRHDTARAHPPPSQPAEETFYFDEATGAVYDSLGRLVQLPPSLDVAQLSSQQQLQQPQQHQLTPPPPSDAAASAAARRASVQVSPSQMQQLHRQHHDHIDPTAGLTREEAERSIAIGMPSSRYSVLAVPASGGDGRVAISMPASSAAPASAPSPSREAPPPPQQQPPRTSLERTLSNASTLAGMSPLGPVRSGHAAPSMDVVSEVDYLPTTSVSREGGVAGAGVGRSGIGGVVARSASSRDIGTTASGGQMVDTNEPVSRRLSSAGSAGIVGAAVGGLGASGMRHRVGGNNALRQSSAGAHDAARSPEYDLGAYPPSAAPTSPMQARQMHAALAAGAGAGAGGDGKDYAYPLTADDVSDKYQYFYDDSGALVAARGAGGGAPGGNALLPGEAGYGYGYGYGGADDGRDQLGNGEGLAHGIFEGVKVGGNGIRMVELEMDQEEDSPYPEVRASVSNIDDPTMPVNTFRMWFLALLLSTIAGGANVFFTFRYPSPMVTGVIVLLVAYPLGKLMAAVLPYHDFQLPRWLGGGSFSLNPGAFNIKEHACIYIMSNVTIAQSYAIFLVVVTDSPYFYNQPRSVLFSILLVISAQLLGFGISGMTRRFLVRPASMIWPQNLVTATILNTLHAEDDGLDGTTTRFRWFSLVSLGAFAWYWMPGFLFSALQQFNWVCWIFPTSHVVNTLFGTASGLGLSVLTFDWSQIQTIGSPLVYPWWAQCNFFAGFLVFVCIISPSLWFSNVWHFGHLPFSSTMSYDRFGKSYRIAEVIGPDSRLDAAKYQAYSSLYLSTTYFMVFWTGFATFTSLITHSVLYHGKTLYRGFKNLRTEEDDVHAKLMRSYREVPDWWYALVTAVCFGVAVVLVEVYNTGMPIWALLIAIAIPVVYELPAGFIFAMTGASLSTNLVSEVVAGYVLPGIPIANMIFKVYAVQVLTSSLGFVQDLKIGHYMKVPPRVTFLTQIIGATWVGLVQVGVKQFMFSRVDDLCSPAQAQRFTCAYAGVFYTASIVWGALGPARRFQKGALYSSIYWAMLAGALAPVPLWLLARKFPRSGIKFINVPIFFNSNSFVPPATGINYTSWFVVGFIFQYLLRKYNFRWWSKYNFVTSAALDFGTVLCSIIIFLVLQLPRNGTISLRWWGNSVWRKTYDASLAPLYATSSDGFAPPPSTA